jgi:vancomycin resistance protein YoaR
MTEPRRRVISLGRFACLGLACSALLLFVLGLARFASGERMLGGLSVGGVSVGGLSVAQCVQRLRERSVALSKQQLRLQLGTKAASLTLESLGVELSGVASAERARAVGRNAGPFADAWRYLRSFWQVENIAAALRVDSAKLDAALGGLDRVLIDDPPFAGGIAFDGPSPHAEVARPGRKIALAAARSGLLQAVALGRIDAPLALSAETFTPHLAPGSLERALALATRVVSGKVTLTAGERRLELEPADLRQLLTSELKGSELSLSVERARTEAWLATRRAALESPAREASFEVSARDEVRVVPSEAGVRLAAEDVAQAIWQASQTEQRAGELPLRREPSPTRSTEQAQALGIRQLVGSFTTRHPCCQPRVDNIHHIATLLDGLLALPGQTLSVNAVVGPRTLKNGFVLAPSIEDGEMVDTVGGGVSQFATTFFNALFHAGYDILERQPHTYWFPRYPMGHEATLSWPKPDIVFKNDSAAGLLVKTSFDKTSITVKLYGDAGGRRVTSSVSERRDIVRPTLELLPNRSVAPDEEKVKEGGMIGWSVIASRSITFADGTKKEEHRKVTYKPRARRVEVHPCRIPKGEPGATGEPCPEPEKADAEAPPAQ